MIIYNRGRFLGEVFKPEDFLSRRKEKPSSDIPPIPSRKPFTPDSFESLINEINSLKAEVKKIKEVLRIHGMAIE